MITVTTSKKEIVVYMWSPKESKNLVRCSKIHPNENWLDKLNILLDDSK